MPQTNEVRHVHMLPSNKGFCERSLCRYSATRPCATVVASFTRSTMPFPLTLRTKQLRKKDVKDISYKAEPESGVEGTNTSSMYALFDVPMVNLFVAYVKLLECVSNHSIEVMRACRIDWKATDDCMLTV